MVADNASPGTACTDESFQYTLQDIDHTAIFLFSTEGQIETGITVPGNIAAGRGNGAAHRADRPAVVASKRRKSARLRRRPDFGGTDIR
jgi:hypothetical protein